METRQLIKDLGGEHTVIISTHILPEVSMICERVIIIHEGQIVAVDRPENLANRLRGVERIEIDAKGGRRDVMDAIRAVEGVQDVEQTQTLGEGVFSYLVESGVGTDTKSKIAAAIVQGGWDLHRLESIGMTLEEIFLRLTTSEEVSQVE